MAMEMTVAGKVRGSRSMGCLMSVRVSPAPEKPGTKLESFALVPVAGIVLLVRDLMLGVAGGGLIVLVLLSSLTG